MRLHKLTRAANSTPGNPDSTKLRLYFVRGAAGRVPRHSGTRDSVPRAHLAGGVTATEQILGKKARDLLLFPDRRPSPAGRRALLSVGQAWSSRVHLENRETLSC